MTALLNDRNSHSQLCSLSNHGVVKQMAWKNCQLKEGRQLPSMNGREQLWWSREMKLRSQRSELTFSSPL